MTKIDVVQPQLPPVPLSRRADAVVVRTDTGLAGQARRLVARAVSAMQPTSWERAVLMSKASPRPRQAWLYRPDDVAPTLFGADELRWDQLAPQSQLVYFRLHDLLDQVTDILRGDIDGSALSGFSALFAQCRPFLEWDAMIDLSLADLLVANVESKSLALRLGLPRLPTDAAAIPGVDELRQRVLYCVDSLQVIYDVALRLQASKRLSDGKIGLPRYHEIVDWFRCYAESLDAVRAINEPAEPERASRRWRRLILRRLAD